MNRKIILKSRPEKEPLKENFQIVEEDLDAVQPGQVQLKSIYLSLDPYMRGRMNAGRSYAKPVELGTVMEGEAVSEVIESKVIPLTKVILLSVELDGKQCRWFRIKL